MIQKSPIIAIPRCDDCSSLQLLTNHHPLEWLKAHPFMIGVAAIVVVIIVVKLLIFLVLRAKGRHLH